MNRRVFLTITILVFFLLSSVSVYAGKMLPLKGSVYSFGTGKGTAFYGIEVTCPNMENPPGYLLVKGNKILLKIVREISFPKYPVPKLVVKLKSGKVLSAKATKGNVPFCIFNFKTAGGLQSLSSFDIDRVVFH